MAPSPRCHPILHCGRSPGPPWGPQAFLDIKKRNSGHSIIPDLGGANHPRIIVCAICEGFQFIENGKSQSKIDDD